MTDDPQTRPAPPAPPVGPWAPPGTPGTSGPSGTPAATGAPGPSAATRGPEASVPPAPPAPARYATVPGPAAPATGPAAPGTGPAGPATGPAGPVPTGWDAPPAPARPRWVVPLVVASCLALLVGVAGLGLGVVALWSSATDGPLAQDSWYVDDAYGEYTGGTDWVGTDSVDGLDVGTCFTVDVDPDDGSGTTAVAESCDDVHTGEVYAVDVVPGDGWPGGQAVADTATVTCEDAFEDYVGLDYWSSTVAYGAVGPTERTWQDGDREVRCFAYVWTSERTGSLEGSGE